MKITMLERRQSAGLLVAAVAILTPSVLCADPDGRIGAAAAALRPPRTTTTSPLSLPLDHVKIRNRARVLGQLATAPDGTRYFAVSDVETLIGATTQDEILRLLQPPAVTDGSVRRVEMLIDLTHTRPLRLIGQPGESIGVATLVVDHPDARNIDVNSIIVSNGLTVIAR